MNDFKMDVHIQSFNTFTITLIIKIQFFHEYIVLISQS